MQAHKVSMKELPRKVRIAQAEVPKCLLQQVETLCEASVIVCINVNSPLKAPVNMIALM